MTEAQIGAAMAAKARAEMDLVRAAWRAQDRSDACLICDKPLTGQQVNYCSRACKDDVAKGIA